MAEIRIATHSIAKRLPMLRAIGFGAEFFPAYRNRHLRMHGLDLVLLSVILRGRGHHVIDEDRFEESGCSVAITHYGQRHDIVTDEEGMDVVNIYLDLERVTLPPLPEPLQSILPDFLPLHPRFQNPFNRLVRLGFEDPEELKSLSMGLVRECAGDGIANRDAARLWLQLFLIACCRTALAQGVTPSLRSEVAPRLERLRRWLDENPGAPFTLPELAARVGMAPTSLCRAFKSYTGRTLVDYAIERRIQAAMVRLRGSSAKILAIALDSGFNDLSHFNRCFKRIAGQTPRDYRRG